MSRFLKENLKEKYNQQIYRGGRSSCSSCSPTYYYHPEKAYAEAHKIWNAEVLKVFDNYEKAMNKLGEELGGIFEKENLTLEMAITEELHKLRIKAIELEDLEDENEEIKERKVWLEEIINDINSILEI